MAPRGDPARGAVHRPARPPPQEAPKRRTLAPSSITLPRPARRPPPRRAPPPARRPGAGARKGRGRGGGAGPGPPPPRPGGGGTPPPPCGGGGGGGGGACPGPPPQPQLGHLARCHAAWAGHQNAAAWRPFVHDRVRLHRSPAGDRDVGRRPADAAARAAIGGGVLSDRHGDAPGDGAPRADLAGAGRDS